jgi:hypothetical protein
MANENQEQPKDDYPFGVLIVDGIEVAQRQRPPRTILTASEMQAAVARQLEHFKVDAKTVVHHPESKPTEA